MTITALEISFNANTEEVVNFENELKEKSNVELHHRGGDRIFAKVYTNDLDWILRWLRDIDLTKREPQGSLTCEGNYIRRWGRGYWLES